MSVGFGFSVGDFYVAIKLVATVIDALGASSKSSSELQELLRQLESLKTALQEVQELQVDDSLHAEVLALKQSAAQCQLTISEFLKKTESYRSSLGLPNKSSSLHCKWKKIQWALCKRKDVVQFKTDLMLHTESIHLLLSAVQTKNTNLKHQSQKELSRSLASHIQDGFANCMRKLSVIGRTVFCISSQAQQCLEVSRRLVTINVQVFQTVLNIQNLLLNIPGQVDRQRPVYLNDAMGRYAPFHLEFIRSAEALISVLSVNFKDAANKIRKGDFTFHDAHTKKDIDLEGPWDGCFMPGQHVEMSMVFDRTQSCSTSCPRCRFSCQSIDGEDSQW